MNDTHGQQGQGWYGFDLDGTLATYDGWKGIDHIGEPIKPMVDIIKRYHAEGKVVKIMTARVAPRKLEDGSIGEQFIYVYLQETGKRYASAFIKEWCEKNLGFTPEIVYQKDALMLWLFDDRVVQVEPNTGKILGKLPENDADCCKTARSPISWRHENDGGKMIKFFQRMMRKKIIDPHGFTTTAGVTSDGKYSLAVQKIKGRYCLAIHKCEERGNLHYFEPNDSSLITYIDPITLRNAVTCVDDRDKVKGY